MSQSATSKTTDYGLMQQTDTVNFIQAGRGGRIPFQRTRQPSNYNHPVIGARGGTSFVPLTLSGLTHLLMEAEPEEPSQFWQPFAQAFWRDLLRMFRTWSSSFRLAPEETEKWVNRNIWTRHKGIIRSCIDFKRNILLRLDVRHTLR